MFSRLLNGDMVLEETWRGRKFIEITCSNFFFATQEKTMGTLGTFVSWLTEATAGIIASLSDPKYWGVIFAVFVLVILYSIVSSINRLGRRLASVSSELSAIRATLREIDLSLGKFDAKGSLDDKEVKGIRDLLFRVDDDQPR
jgi:hypothetical protein